MKGRRDLAIPTDKTPVKVRKSQIPLELLPVKWDRPLFDLCRVKRNLTREHLDAKEGNGNEMEFTLLRLYEQLVLEKTERDSTDMFSVGQELLWIDQNIIKADEDNMTNHVPEYLVIKVLENRQGFVWPKWHDQIFIVARGSVESRLSLTSLIRTKW